MYELSRVRLHSVGPRGARYQDVTLDLRDVGPVVSRPVQEALFGMDEPDTVVLRRPSPASVLFLENGGGKSVLLKLIFSVMLPFRRQVVGTTSTRVLENFVLAHDVAQVALEWQHTTTGQRVVTGKVSAWRDHVVSADPNRLAEAWYSFRPTATFNLDTLPFTEQDRLVSLAGFRDRLDEASKKEPELQAVWERGREAWTVNLTHLGLDPELFAYQRRMNAGEGEAADVFTFRTDEAFVDWLLTAVTGEDDPRGLGDVVASYATRLAERQSLRDERDFVAGALDRITPLSEAAGEAERAQAGYRQARRAAQQFAATIAMRADREREQLAGLTELVAEAAEGERTADQNKSRLNKIVNELRRLVAGLRWRQAEEQRKRLRQELDRARELQLAWQQTETLVRHAEARQQAEAVRAAVREQEHQAAPVLERRNQAARLLARGLLAAAKTAEAQASSYEHQAGGLTERAGEAARLGEEAVAQAATQREKAAQAERHLDGARAAVEAAVADGLLPSVGADVDALAARASIEADQAKEHYAEARTRLGWLAAERKAANDERARAEGARADRQAAEADAARKLSTAEQAAAGLVGEDRLTGLLGVAEVVLDTDAPTLLGLLATAIEDATAEQTQLRMAEAADERTLAALGSGGLLPPDEQLIEAVRVLERAGITAWSGWQYLAEAAVDARTRMLASYPHLVGGIVLNRADQLGDAERVLGEARLLPRAIVAVGTTAAMTRLDGAAPAGLEFLVDPNPAMYDPETAQRERDRLLAARAERQARLARLAEQIEADQQLRRRLVEWRDAYPPPTSPARSTTLDQLREAHRHAREAQDAAEVEVGAAQQRVRELEQREQELHDRLAGLHDAETAARNLAARLAALAERVAQVPGWQAELRAAGTTGAAAGEAAARHRVETTRLRAQAEQARRTASDHRRTAETCRSELSVVVGGGDVDESTPVPPEPVEELRAAHQAASAAYQKVQVGADLRADLDQAERDEAGTRAAVERLDPDLRELAASLLASPDGADAPSRAAATERATTAAHRLDAEHNQQTEEVGRLRNDYERAPKQEVSLEPYGRPRDIAHGEQLAARAEADWEAARLRYDQVQRRLVDLQGQARKADDSVRAFTAHLDALATVAAEDIDPETEPFPGTDADARGQRTELMARLSEAEQRRDEQARAVRRATDELARYATQERFEKVTSPVRRQITTVERERLPEFAAEWDSALRPRLRTLEQDLAQIEQHRASIVERLAGMVQQALRTLHSAQRLSRLPDGLGDWSGQDFLRIRFAEPDPAVLAEKLGQVIDEATAGDGKGSAKRDGLSLLLQGVRAATTPKGVRVEMLKPDAVLRTERVRVADIGDVFSGGQLLTAAIILYCTMAHLRANERGYTRRPHAGVLFLDNPIGRASAGYLLELQLSVAEALQVQLIYTTGLFDVNALSVFPLMIRLRNDADLRAGRAYLSVESQVRGALERLPGPDGTGAVTSTRLFRRPVP